MSTRLQAVLFDVDGTLADTEEFHRQAFNVAFSEADLDWHWDRALYSELLVVTGGKERIRHYLSSRRPDFELPSAADEFIAGLHARKTVAYTSDLAGGAVTLRPGVERLIREVRDAGLRLAIVTTTTPANVSALLENSFSEQMTDWFDVIAAGSIVPHKKPAPDIYQYALKKLDLQAGQCIALEDSRNGLLSAHAAGVGTIITVNHFTKQQDFSEALLVLDHLGEPDSPCTVLSGQPFSGTQVDVSLLTRLHDR